MARLGDSIHFSDRRHGRCLQPRQKLMEQEILELKNYLPEWTAAKQHEKPGIFTAIARAARLFSPKLDHGQWKKRKQIYKTRLFKNKKKKETKDMIKYGRKWTPRMVVYQQNRDDVLKRIEAKYRAKPGAPDMFKYYQVTVWKVMEELLDEELEKAKETADEWSNNIPPPEIQVQVASKKGPTYMEHFSNEMWRQCRMRVFVLSAWKNEQGQVLFGMHDDNEALGDADSFMKTKDWEDIEPMWQEYAQAQFTFELDVNGEGIPSLLDTVQTKLEEKKAIAVVPWSAIIECEDDFVSPMYLPSGVHLKDPSKLQHSNATALLNFWYAHQENGDDPIFLFKAWKNKVGNMMKPVSTGGSDKSSSNESHACIPHWGIMIRRPRDSSTKSEIDGDDDSGMDEDGARTVHKGVRVAPGPLSARIIGQGVRHPLPKPHLVRPARPVQLAAGPLLGSQMGNLLMGLTREN
ncbi:uncharacterized protein EDB91DRAFT_1088339 [Suillus paluster]|uniref:uncharacterized protein n=1 Tax=Suillus paluster TaxID=48578 RepID=UPI001B86EF15|nr:uncharacterized protein EDB91DRAFT_1088339 [Suillus paluster]KAG1721823.1 hypothetical protein EDB91DRAFT_1088339 [Suillus paluster]